MLSTQINATSIRHKIRLTIGFVFFPAFRLFVFISRIIQTSPPTVEFNLSFFLNDKSICDGVFFFSRKILWAVIRYFDVPVKPRGRQQNVEKKPNPISQNLQM